MIENSSASSPLVLVVEHEARLRESMAAALGLSRYACDLAPDGLTALRHAAARTFDLVLVDLGAPDVQRLEICRLLRQQPLNRRAAIIVIAGDDGLAAALAEIEHGADDFLMKPFGCHELAARARAAIHRARAARANGHRAEQASAQSAPAIAHQDIRLDPARRHVSVGDRPVQLTEQEFHLLYVLTAHPGIVFSRDKLLGRIWGQDRYVTARSVDTLVSRLRRRIEPDGTDDPRYIRTVRGVGYKLGDA